LDVTTGQLADIQADLGSQLADFFKAIQTVYLEVVNYSYDNTQCLVSSTHGASNYNHHGNGGGQPQ